MVKSLLTFLAPITGLAVVAAQTSLFIPGLDPQPISADIAGVDSEGRTTWIIHPGTPSGTLTEIGFQGTATLVEGPSQVSFTYAGAAFTQGMDCTVSGGLAICSATDTSGSLVTETETASPFAIQFGSTITPTASPTASPSGTASPAPSGATSKPINGTSAPTSSVTPNSASMLAPGLFTIMGCTLMGFFAM